MIQLRSKFVTHEFNELLANHYEKIHNEYEILFRNDLRYYVLIHFSDIYNGITIRPKKIKQFNSPNDLINYLYEKNLILKGDNEKMTNFDKIYEGIEKRRQIANKIGKGYKQRYLLEKLLQGIEIQFNLDYCQKTYFYNNYVQSLLNLINRLNENGYETNLTMGKNGGYWTSKLKITNLYDNYGTIYKNPSK